MQERCGGRAFVSWEERFGGSAVWPRVYNLRSSNSTLIAGHCVPVC